MKVFISYSSKDKEIAEQIYLALVKENFAVFFDKQSLPVSGNYNRRIRDAISKSDVLIFLISQYSVEKSYALTELKYFQEYNKNPKDKVLPVRLDDVAFDKVPGYLKAVTILEPEGNTVAETVYEVGRLNSAQRKPWLWGGAILVFLISMYFASTYILENYIYSCPKPYFHKAGVNLDDLMVKVEKGNFSMGSDGGKEDEIDGFYMNKYKVTNKQYGEFVKNTGYKVKGSWVENYPVSESFHPVINVTYNDASEYCRSLSKRLPTTIEWEYTCRGEYNSRYPWGNTFKKHMANVDGYCNGTTVVGSFSSRESDFGIKVSGMFGNVMEWTEGQIIGAEGKLNVARGQSHSNNIKIYDCGMPLRVSAKGDFKSNKIGFRCAK